ncbi:MAG: RHS repeat-associated core domain-containing protein, partial [Steroidobacteraceae bacterium]
GLDEYYAQVSSSGILNMLSDALGSTIATTDATGAIATSYGYGPYGATTQSGNSGTPFQFAGRENDGASNLYFFRARYYSPELGRFISRDPSGLLGGPNAYAYADGNPISLTDPLGLFSGVGGGFGGGGASGSWGSPDPCSFGSSPPSAANVTGSSSAGLAAAAAGAAVGGPQLWSAGLNGGDNSVFWSGYSQGARAIAEGLGGTTLEQTPIGSALDYLSNGLGVPGLTPVWNAASATFAGNATGVARAVILAPGTTWTTIEAPILLENDVLILFFLP